MYTRGTLPLRAWLAMSAFAAASLAQARLPGTWHFTDADGAQLAVAASEAMCDNVTDGGAIAGDVTGCPNPTFQAPTIMSVTLPSGGSGDLEFAWMITYDDPAGAQPVSWSIMPGTNAPDYTPAPLSQTAYFMRCARRAGCTEYAGESNYVTVHLDCCDNATDGGAIAGEQTACGVPYDPTLISNSAPASGGSFAMNYAWYTSTTSDVYAPGDAAWTALDGATFPWLDPAPVSQVTHFVRVATRQFCDEPGAWSNVVTVYAHPAPTLKADVVDVTCFGDADGSAAVTIQNAASPFAYRWLDDPTTSLTRTGLVAGTYEFEITDANGCVSVEEVVVGSPDELSVSGSVDFDACAFADDAEARAAVSGGTAPYTYAWSTGATTPTVEGLAAGSYDVDVTDASGCTASATVVVNPPAALTASANTVDPTCYDASGEIEVVPAGGTAPFTYAWTPNVSTTDRATGLVGGTYVIVVGDANGCEMTVTVAFDDTDALALTLETHQVTCNGAADAAIRSTLTGGIPPYSYAWSSGETTADLAAVTPGTYTLTVTDGNGCTVDATTVVVEPDALTASVTVTQMVCREDGGGIEAVLAGGTPPYNFAWSDGAGANFYVRTGLPAGTYTLSVTDANGCTATADGVITDVPQMFAAATAIDARCPGEADGSATATGTGGEAPYSYVWSDGQTTQTASNLAAGNYTVVITDVRGCEKTASVEVENASEGPQVTADITPLDCAGDTSADIDLTVSGGIAPYTFAWDDLVFTEDRTGLPAGTYEVTVTDANGCEAVETYEIVDPEPLTCRASPTTNFPDYFHVSAFGAGDGAASVAVTGGAGGYTYAWSDGSTGAAAAGLGGGLVSVTVTDASGCTCTHDTTLVEPSIIADRVWEDTDGDGIQDAGEPGLEGVRVRLTGADFNGRPVNFSATSAADGAYRFDQLPMGTYFINFRLQRNVHNHLVSPADQGGDDAVDSDVNPITNTVSRVVTAHGVGDYDTDAGYIPRASVVLLGDRVWYDEDHDGVQDPFESGLQGVTVNLYREVDDFLVATTRTSEEGEYAFADVVPGTYYLTVDQSTSTIGAGFVLTDALRGTDPDLDSDIDGATMRSLSFDIEAGDPDELSYDVGLHANCGEVDTPGVIAGDESVCDGEVPGPITSLSVPSGAVEYQWYRSNGTAFQGPNDPAWAFIPGATAADYQPAAITETVSYIRKSRLSGCVDYTGVSNVVTKTVIALPNAEITSAPVAFCISQPQDFTAQDDGQGVFEWDFGADATPRYVSGPVATGVAFGTHSVSFYVYLTVTNAQGCIGRDSVQLFTQNCFGGGDVDGLRASTSGGLTTLIWQGVGYEAGSYFRVERSDGQAAGFEHLVDIAVVERYAWADFAFEDAFAPSGQVSYRVTVLAPNVAEGRSRQLTLTVEQDALRASAYPNPVADVLTLELAAAQRSAVAYRIVDRMGRVLDAGSVPAGRATVNVSRLPRGSYFVRLFAEDGTAASLPLTKQ